MPSSCNDTLQAPAIGSVEDKLIHKLDTSRMYRERARLALAFARKYPDRQERLTRLRAINRGWEPDRSNYAIARADVLDYLSDDLAEAMYS